ncbi:hypothetical protein [Leptospirillum ferriphilum]|uniref:hypothetical protein n=1 Tax=Leptospirillum ferriphilum TaxID=178606 RepID=UPI0015C3F5C0|nr:hypothetical protein [Leptospirillum ferriphilum]
MPEKIGSDQRKKHRMAVSGFFKPMADRVFTSGILVVSRMMSTGFSEGARASSKFS